MATIGRLIDSLFFLDMFSRRTAKIADRFLYVKRAMKWFLRFLGQEPLMALPILDVGNGAPGYRPGEDHQAVTGAGQVKAPIRGDCRWPSHTGDDGCQDSAWQLAPGRFGHVADRSRGGLVRGEHLDDGQGSGVRDADVHQKRCDGSLDGGHHKSEEPS